MAVTYETNLVVLPNCDLHIALNGTPPLHLRVYSREHFSNNRFYTLTEVTNQCSFDFFAPYNAVGNRLQQFANIDPNTGLITPISVGTNLVQIRWEDHINNRTIHHYAIIRIQVHDRILGWWFGNSSVTTALDNQFAHAQPSIYAIFSDDPSGTDLVGDITGHGFVPLTSSNNAIFTTNADGRLQGLQEGNAHVSGTFLGSTKSLQVRVVDYAKARNNLEYVQIPNIDQPETMHNILFMGEGFRDVDRSLFDKIVEEVVEEMFSKPRHSPFSLLEGSFNIWKAYEPSLQHGITCGFRINDEETLKLEKGYPIPFPYNHPTSSAQATYLVRQLVKIVGLPLRNETRNTAQLKALWSSQSLGRFDSSTQTWVANFDPNMVDDDLVDVWRIQKSLGILEARDTFFGLSLGTRYGDRLSSYSIDPRTGQLAPVLPPTADNPADPNLVPFIKRIYEWFDFETSVYLTPDPRRHPPQLQAGNRENLGNSIIRYIEGLSSEFPPHPNVGREWLPDPQGLTLKRSRGLIALISYDELEGGTNFNALTITACTTARNHQLKFEYATNGNERKLLRILPDSINENIDEIIDMVTHEFGHSFKLDDEYERLPADGMNSDDSFDNVASWNHIRVNAVNYPKIDPDRVKWLKLPRILLSNILIKNSETENNQLKVTIDPKFIGRWIEAKAQNLKVYLRQFMIDPVNGNQLPIPFSKNFYLERLEIGDISSVNGTILLGGAGLPAQPFPIFSEGSLLFIPKLNSAGDIELIVQKKVLDTLRSTNLPLNLDTDTSKVNSKQDEPIDIPDFKPPCKKYKLVGIYEGANEFTRGVYRPAGLCKMRYSKDPSWWAELKGTDVGDGEFCYVCKYLIVQRVDPTFLDLLDKKYYPEAKQE